MHHAMKVASFDLNRARALHHLLEEAHVGRAAARLGITPAAASNALQRLRREMGDPLLVRDRYVFVRTALGEQLRAPARDVVAAAERLLQTASPFDARSFEGHLDVAIAEHVALALLPALDDRIRTRAPRATLRVRPVPLAVTDWLLESGGVLVGPASCVGAPREATSAASVGFYDDGFVCVLREGHPLLRRAWTPASFAAAEHVLVTPRGASDRGAIDDGLQAVGLTRRVARVVSSFSLAIPLLRANDYVGTMPSAFARHADLKGLRVRPPPLVVRPVAMRLIWHLAHGHTGKVALLRELLVDAAEACELNGPRGVRRRGSSHRRRRFGSAELQALPDVARAKAAGAVEAKR